MENFLDTFLNRTPEQVALDNQALMDKIAQRKATYTKLIHMNEAGLSVKEIRAYEKESGMTLSAAYYYQRMDS